MKRSTLGKSDAAENWETPERKHPPGSVEDVWWRRQWSVTIARKVVIEKITIGCDSNSKPILGQINYSVLGVGCPWIYFIVCVATIVTWHTITNHKNACRMQTVVTLLISCRGLRSLPLVSIVRIKVQLRCGSGSMAITHCNEFFNYLTEQSNHKECWWKVSVRIMFWCFDEIECNDSIEGISNLQTFWMRLFNLNYSMKSRWTTILNVW